MASSMWNFEIRTGRGISEVTKSHPKGDDDKVFNRLISQMNRGN